MINFATGLQYVLFYFNALLLITIIYCVGLILRREIDKYNPEVGSFIGYGLFFLLVFYMGYRPISYVFGDMSTYAQSFNLAKSNWNYALAGEQVTFVEGSDIVFDSLMVFCAKYTSVENFFLIVDIIYLLPYLLVCRKFFKKYWFIAFLAIWTSLSFWTFGTNGLRNGMATSIFICIFLFNNKLLQVGFMILAIGMHKSLILPSAAYIFTLFFSNTTLLLRFWILCIPLSFVAGNVFESLIAQIGFGGLDKRISSYINPYQDIEYNIGFRLDFLLYSAIPIYIGWYYIEKLKYNNSLYRTIYHIYIISNAFWILVIRAPFSNRFAYLSWFLMGFILVFPLLKQKIIKNQAFVLGIILIINILFTYYQLVLRLT